MNTLDDFIAIHTGHPPIHEHQIEGRFHGAFQQRQCIRPIGDGADLQAEKTQHFGKNLA